MAHTEDGGALPPVLARRLTAQLLAGPPAPDPVTVAERLLAVQGQDQRGARLAVRARTSGLSVADVDRALTDERSLVITWLNRGTLHLVRSQDYPWLHALTTPPLQTGIERRLRQEGVEADAAERGVEVIERSLVEEGPLTRYQLRDRVAAAGVRTERQAMVHLLALASLRGLIVRGPIVGLHHAYVLVRDWLGESPPVDREQALAELARRYLLGHGPADDRDLARWTGLPLRDARFGLGAIAAELVQRDDGLLDLAGRPAETEPGPARLLGVFDPVLLGWCSRDLLLATEEAMAAAGGLMTPFLLVGGRVGGTWSLSRGEVALTPFDWLSRADAAALEADAADVARFLAAG